MTSTDRPPIRILIMDDSLFGRDCLRMLLSELPCVAVTATAASVVEARAPLRETRLDVVVVSPHQLDPSGAAAVRAVKKAAPSARVIVLSNCRGDACRAECIASGADAFLDKSDVFRRVYELLREWFDVDDEGDFVEDAGSTEPHFAK